MDDEVNKLIGFISDSEKNSSLNKLFGGAKAEKMLVVAMMLFGSMAVLIAALGISPKLAIVSGTVFIFLTIAHFLSQVISIYSIFRNPLKLYLDGLKEREAQRAEYVRDLSNFSRSSLRRVSELMELDNDFFIERSAFLVGSIKKVGVVPAGFAIYYAAHKQFELQSHSWVPMWLMAFVLGVYMGAIILERVSTKIKSQVGYINEAIEYSDNNFNSTKRFNRSLNVVRR
ncbi:MAG: hypothetical protein ABFS08_10255 [Pseudomonadota bacterium]